MSDMNPQQSAALLARVDSCCAWLGNQFKGDILTRQDQTQADEARLLMRDLCALASPAPTDAGVLHTLAEKWRDEASGWDIGSTRSVQTQCAAELEEALAATPAALIGFVAANELSKLWDEHDRWNRIAVYHPDSVGTDGTPKNVAPNIHRWAHPLAHGDQECLDCELPRIKQSRVQDSGAIDEVLIDECCFTVHGVTCSTNHDAREDMRKVIAHIRATPQTPIPQEPSAQVTDAMLTRAVRAYVANGSGGKSCSHGAMKAAIEAALRGRAG